MENNKLKSLRREKKVTQSQMAQLLGYSNKSGYCHLENGLVKMTVDKAKAIADYLGVDVTKIFFANEVEETSTNKSAKEVRICQDYLNRSWFV